MSGDELRRSQLHRLSEIARKPLEFYLDGRPCHALEGDTVLTAILTQQGSLRRTEFSGQPRGGFCMMGACQDCWVMLETGQRVRSCTTLLEPGMRLVTSIETLC